ncbi:MAG: T9SS type A sorting domain-containing protein [Saprospiraceae bacterium]|nr:T9SS type A sorting domain-containing protein [Saprospiraceae bacterium]
MKKLNILFFVFIVSVLSLGAVLDNPRNPPLGRTGAPGETTCENKDCHHGGTFVGKVSLTGMPDTVISGTKYNLTLTQTSDALRGGFQVTALDGSNLKAGSFSNVGNSTNIGTQGGREYIRQSRAVLLNNGAVSWNFDWTAPINISKDDTIKFYFVSNATNNDDNDTGDNTLVNTKKVVFQIATEIDDLQESNLYDFKILNRSFVFVPYNEVVSVALFGLSGNVIHQQENLSSMTPVAIDLDEGLYILNVKFKNKQSISKKFVIQ